MPSISSNRLAHEKSPYLLQHAHNPVDWYPWGDEAFHKARVENKPIFLSIGYSTCHWCHVMERESFENDSVAEVLNQSYVPIKVDREERPDVDRIYMAFVQATTGGGGWPMSVFLTPALEPFFGGTYFPPDSRYGRPGFRDLLLYLARKWNEDRPRIAEAGTATLNQLRQISHGDPASNRPEAITQDTFDRAYNYFRRIYDARLGGFGGAPKFPRPVVHNFLLRYGNPDAVAMVTHTLDEMAKGGMHDQIGGGFHRYSVDDHWFVPHFEKMLYDQAQLATSYLEAFQITGGPQHAETARGIFEYVLRDLVHPEGGFYSAEDADSVIDDAPTKVKGEGAFYVWKQGEIRALLHAEEYLPFCDAYGVRANGNVEEDPHQEFTGRNILYRASEAADYHQFAPARARLLAAREKRTRPHLDDKVLTSWNGLMISAFALGARVLGDQRYTDAARNAALFVLRHLYRPEDAALLRRYRDGEAAIPGFLDDYAFFIQGLADLYEACFEPYFLDVALQLAAKMIDLFEDREHGGGFYSTMAGDPSLVVRMKDDYDGAEPSGNSIAVSVLLRLARLTEQPELNRAAARALEAFSGRLKEQGVAVPQMLSAAMASLVAPHHIVLAGSRDAAMRAMELTIAQRFLPLTSTVLIDSVETRAALSVHMPWLARMTVQDGHATAYVCQNFACQLPVTDVHALAELLN